MRARLRAVVATAALAALVGAGQASAATSTIAAYDTYVQGQGFDIRIVDLGTGADIPVPAGVNTSADEYHPALTPDGRHLVFTRATIQPFFNGDVVPPDRRDLLTVNRQTGSGFNLESGGTGATITAGNPLRLALGLRPSPSRSSGNPSTIVRAASLSSSASPPFTAIAGESLNSTAPFAGEGPGSVADIPTATLLGRGSGNRTHAYTQIRYNSGTGAFQDSNLILEQRLNGSPTPTSALTLPLKQHAALRPSDGFVVMTHIAGVANSVFTLNFPAQTEPERAPAPINPASNNSQNHAHPAWSPDGVKLAFTRRGNTVGATRRLFLYDNTPGIQAIQNPGIVMGSAPTRQLDNFQQNYGSVSVAVEERPDSVNVSCTSNCLSLGTTLTPRITSTSISSLGTVGIIVHRVTGTRRVLGRRVPRLKRLGRVPLGKAKRGRNRFKWNLRVNGRRLRPGTHVLTFRSLAPNGRIQSTSRTLRFKLTRSRKITAVRTLR